MVTNHEKFKLHDTEEMRQRREEFRKKLQERGQLHRGYHGISSVYRANSHNAAHNPSSSLGDLSVHPPPALRRSNPSISIATQVNDKERSSQLRQASPEEVAIRSLVKKTINEALQEVTQEGEDFKLQMENHTASRLAADQVSEESQNVHTNESELGEGSEEDPTAQDMAPEGDLESTPDGDEDTSPIDEDTSPIDEEERNPTEEEPPPKEEDMTPSNTEGETPD